MVGGGARESFVLDRTAVGMSILSLTVGFPGYRCVRAGALGDVHAARAVWLCRYGNWRVT
jgi:hypothetical protein